MAEIKWSLKHITSGLIINITKSVFKVGRSLDADLISESSVLSRNHATITILRDGLCVQDNLSSNGTFINNSAIPPIEPIALNHRDVVGFGCCQKFKNTKKDDIIEIYEILKEEPSGDIEPPAATKNENVNGFSVEDNNCIVISDDENEDFACSQIFEITKKVKNDQTSYIESIDPYAEIKEELRELDHCEKIVAVDLTKEEQQITDSYDLLSILESSEPVAQNLEKFNLPTEACQNLIDVNKSVEEAVKLDIFPEEQEKIEENCLRGKLVVKLKPLDKSMADIEKTIDKITSRIQKSIVPPIIEPHETKLKTSRQSRASEKSKPNQDGKRKKNAGFTTPNKKLKTTYNSKDSKNTSQSTKKDEHKKTADLEIAQERKRKLKKLAETSKTSVTNKKSIKTAPKVKISDGRGQFLLEQISLPSTSIQKSVNIPTAKSDQKKSDCKEPFQHLKSKKANKADQRNDKLNLKEPSSCSSMRKGNKDVKSYQKETKLDSEKTFSYPSSKEVNKSVKKPHSFIYVQDTTVSIQSNIHQIPVSPSDDLNGMLEMPLSQVHDIFPNKTMGETDFEKMNGKVMPVFGNLINNLPVINSLGVSRPRKDLDNVDADIAHILHWPFKWLREQTIQDHSPPVYGSKKPIQVPRCFRNFSTYVDTMNPFVKLELWQYVYQTLYNKEEERSPVYVDLKHMRKVRDVVYLDGECHVPANDWHFFRPDDFILTELRVKDSETCYQYAGFGYIKYCQRINTTQGDNSGSNLPNTTLTVLMRTTSLEIYGKKILIRVIANIGSSLKLLKTMNYLERSPLCNRILNPNIRDFSLPRESNSLLNRVRLNSIQKCIIAEASSVCLRNSPGMYLIKGPPGTGKSTVIVNLIFEILLRSQSAGVKVPLILLAAPSNAAVDGVLLKLMNFRLKLPEYQKKLFKLVRLGPDSSINKEVDKFKLHSLALNDVIISNKLNTLGAYKKHLKTGNSLEEFLKNQLKSRYWYEIKQSEENLLLNSNIICTTLNSSVGYRLSQLARRNKLQFTCCIIDEATQCTELESLLPLQLGIDKFVLVGDPQQLHAVVCNKVSQKYGYGKSLFSRIDENFKNLTNSPIRMLCDQYRMKPEICEYPNKTFYGGKLNSIPVHTDILTPVIKPYLLFNITRMNEDTSDYMNTDEAWLIHNLLETLLAYLNPSCKYTIGIITPYRAQRELLRKFISSISFGSQVRVTVNTVDSFQGMENDIIIISCVRFHTNNFLQNEQRLNVALTRARQALYIVGNYGLFKHCKSLYDLREDAKRRKLCWDVKDDPKNLPNLRRFITP